MKKRRFVPVIAYGDVILFNFDYIVRMEGRDDPHGQGRMILYVLEGGEVVPYETDEEYEPFVESLGLMP